MGRKVELITRAQYARHRGCSEQAVHRAIKEGRISLIDGRIDLAVADLQWEQNTRARTRNATVGAPAPMPGSAKPAVPPAATGYADARTRRELAEAELAEIEAATARRTMVLRADVDRGVFEASRELRDRLISCADRIAAEVAALSSASDCYEVVSREHRAALAQTALTLRQKLGPSPSDQGSSLDGPNTPASGSLESESQE